MTRSQSSTLVSLSLIVGLGGGCARSTSPTLPTPEPNVAAWASDLERVAPGQPIEQVLMDRFPGVEVASRPGGGVTMRIRGAASFYANSDPLLVVDGVTMDAGPSGMTWLNPHDIAYIKVLKNPSETAIYGVRGANGVIVVTTKGSVNK